MLFYYRTENDATGGDGLFATLGSALLVRVGMTWP
ncbi:unannotated protein [freshwater metagenome]|uniref:Unannotated protein n=1 Tax=freshwater metagenome TaxID=449393 RepID=A0A6J7D1P0_9ZZZZ